MTTKQPIIGIFGAGQLGRMLAEAGHPLGMEFRFLDPAKEISAHGLGEHFRTAYEDREALEKFAQGIDAATFEFENVPSNSVAWISERVYTAPNADALHIAADRALEKALFEELGIPIPLTIPASNRKEWDVAVTLQVFPCIVKTRRFGYDGKGQFVLRTAEEFERAFTEIGDAPVVFEEMIRFDREVSLIAVRSRSGECRFYPLVENHHRGGILRLTHAPAPDVTERLQQQAENYGRKLLNKLDYVGVLAVEFFLCGDRLLANEMAPRVHNSGHWSIEGAVTSQFENHLRAVADMPLGECTTKGFSAMVNLIGAIPDVTFLTDYPGLYIHDYDKSPRAGRKVGHLTIVESTRDGVLRVLREIASIHPELLPDIHV